ncbi:MAG: LLM class flavin-dependent oxidoreductase [Candidatus Bathyarchaeia archaeon]|jgi:probable F420-dependent oxidoreductase
MNRIGFGLVLPTFSGINDTHLYAPCYEKFDYSLTRKTARLAEEIGYDGLWICDHLAMGNGWEIAECWTVLSALAAVTDRIRLGTSVLCDSHRNPALMAKMAATLDDLSGGRVDYGIGAGWHEIEQTSYGLPWLEKPIERIRRMEEGIEVVKRMWTEDKANFSGKYYRIKEATCYPKPIQKPHPPIWIGARGERMLKSVARYADAWNYFSTTVQQHRDLMNVIRKSCELLCRNYDHIMMSWEGMILIAETEEKLKTEIAEIHRYSPRYPISMERKVTEMPRYPYPMQYPESYDFRAQNLFGTPDQIVERLQQYIDIGVKYFTLSFLDYPSTEGIELFAERVIPEL